jgi:tRNA(Ile)-lysidine synthase
VDRKTHSKAYSKTKLLDLEFRVWRKLKPLGLEGKRLLIACSGGLDSLVLLAVMSAVAPRLGLQIEAVTVHHGRSSKKRVAAARSEALRLVQTYCTNRQIPFRGVVRDRRKRELKSEAELREFRRDCFRQQMADGKFDFVVLAHHADDLFETRILRLIRGTGPQGLGAMSSVDGVYLRPFLECSRQQITAYAEKTGLQWSEDPSNGDPGYLRNWVRRHWLPMLEARQSGAQKAFARSLDVLTEAFEQEGLSRRKLDLGGEGAAGISALPWQEFAAMSPPQQRTWLAQLLLRLNGRDFSRGQIDEVRKRLLAARRHRFQMMGLEWSINAGQITVLSKPGRSKSQA